MIKIHEIWWPASRNSTLLAYCVCQHCNSDDCSYSPEDGSWQCWHCGKDDQGQLCREYEYDCPECGWHILAWDRDDPYPWRCKRCRAGYKGDKETGPIGEPSYPDLCPVCGVSGVFGYVYQRQPWGQYTDYYRCEHCDTEFLAGRYGRMIQPEPCSACGYTAVQLHRHVGYGPWRRIGNRAGQVYEQEQIVTRIKRCTICKQYYDLDLWPIDRDLKPILPVEADDDPGEHIVIGVASEYAPTTKE